jgi:hypothetical protein
MGFMPLFIAAWLIPLVTKGFGPWYTAIPVCAMGWFSIRYVFRLLDAYL